MNLTFKGKLESLESAVEYAKACIGDTNVYYTEDPWPHGHWHVVWASSAEHYDNHPGYDLKAKVRVQHVVELV